MNYQNTTETNDSIGRQATAFWQGKRVIVTGGGGFLGSFVVNKLWHRGAAEVIVPRRKDYDLRNLTAIRQLLRDTSLPGNGTSSGNLKSKIQNPPSIWSSIWRLMSAASGSIAPSRQNFFMTT
jgi:hypothetical protein